MEFNITSTWYLILSACSLIFLISIASYARSGLPPLVISKKVVLVVLRAAALGLVLFLLLDPHNTHRSSYREPVEFAVLIDASSSMAYADDTAEKEYSRWRDAITYFEKQVRPALTTDSIVTTYTFGERLERVDDPATASPQQLTTELAAALEEVLADGRDAALGGVLVISDGQIDDDVQTLAAIRKYRRGGIPVYTYCCGLAVEAPDVAIASVDGGQIIPFEPRVRLAIDITSPGFAGQNSLLTVHCGERLLYERPVELTGEMIEHTVSFDTPYRGFYAYDVKLSCLEGERLEHNNSMRIGLNVADQKIRVLYMEGTPNATHTLEDALESDPDIEVVSLYFPQNVSDFERAKRYPYQTDAKQRRVYNVADERRGFPKTMEGLVQYDVIINSDIYRQAFTSEQLDNTVALVEQFGGGFVMVGGVTAFGAGHYDETVIDKLMPVDCYGARDYRFVQFQLEVPDRALDHPIMQVGDSAEETKLAWSSEFPGFNGLNLANRAKPGALALARHETMSNKYGKMVVFAVQQIGRGRTMAFTPDTTENWGTQFESRWGREDDPIHYYRRFWINAVRWLAADRIQRKQSEFVVRCSARTSVPGEPVTVSIPIPAQAPVKDVSLRSTSPDGTERLLDLTVDPVEHTLRTEFASTHLGTHILTARMQRGSDDLVFAKNMVHVTPNRREQETTKANPQLMRKLADITNADSLNNKSSDDLAASLGELGTEFVEYRQTSIWDRLPMMLVLLSLLTTEWFVRRRSGLV